MRIVLAIALTFPLATFSFAGEERDFFCRHCGLKGTFASGGGFSFMEISAFCTKKEHFVSISWGAKEREPKPVRYDGTVAIYKCPICKTPTVRRWDQRECPRCGSRDIKISDIKMFYD
jgi:hypothetical protein